MSGTEFEISTDPARIDVALVHGFLSESYWAQGRSREVVERSIRNSLCFGIYRGEQQVAFARLITDRATFAYLADVFVLPQFRGLGLAKRLMRAILAVRELRGLRLIMLRTRDAHGLYTQFGFQPLENPGRVMELRGPN